MAAFQARFLHALLAPAQGEGHDAHGAAGFAAQPAFAVYRNTVARACIEALEANFPVVARLVGTDWFREVATAYLHAAPPRDPRLLHYGEGFADFLAPLAAAHGLDYLPGVARLDALWRVAHAAADADPLDLQRLAQQPPEALAETVLRLHPATRWASFPDMPVGAIWQRERAQLASGDAGASDAQDAQNPRVPLDAPGPPDNPGTPEPIPWCGDGILLTRPGDAVRWTPLDAAGCRFLDACAQGLPLGDAADQALCCDPGLDPGALLHRLLDAGAFCETPMP